MAKSILALRAKKFKNMSKSAQVFLVLCFLFFFVEAIIHIIPFLWVINSSFRTNEEIYNYPLEIAKNLQWVNYRDVITEFKVAGGVTYVQMLGNSIWQTSAFLFINILSSTLVAYALAKFKFPGRNFLYGLMIFTQTIPIMGTGITEYKLKFNLGMINNPYTIWLSWAMGFDFSAFIIFGSFKGISNAYMESAMIDGANDFKIFFEIILPQVIPAIVALMVTNFVTMWNNYTVSQISLNKYPNLAYGLHLFEKSSLYLPNSRGIYYAAMIFVSLPGVLFYALAQNLIINNLSVGGLKG